MTALPGTLVDVGWLAGNLDGVVVMDCRWSLADPTSGPTAYEDGHIPGAVYASLDDDLSDMSVPDAGRHPLPTRAAFAETLQRLGVANGTSVVVYDDMGGAIASRAWWLLRWVGHDQVAILDGGIQAWTAAGLGLERGVVSLPAARFVVGPDTMPVADRGDVANRAPRTSVLDAREPERFRGEIEPRDPVAGHIPGAGNAPWAGNLEAGRFLSPDELARRYAALGIDGADETIVYCGSGVTACHDIAAMEIAGLGTAALYPGSWSEWSTAGGEVATGE